MKYLTLAKKQGSKVLALAGLMTMSALSMAADGGADVGSIGSAAAVEIAKFAIMVSAIGAAILSVTVLIQGFRMAFAMVKSAR